MDPDNPNTQLPEAAEAPPVEQVDSPPLRWQAQEYIHLEKGIWWYVIFGVVALGLIAADIFFLRSWTFSVLVIVMSVAVIMFLRRPPRTIQYAVSPRQGLYIGEQLHHWEEFRAFGIVEDSGHYSLMLVPVKRFSPGISVYFPEEIGEQLVDVMAARLPMEELKLDFVDALIRKLRF